MAISTPSSVTITSSNMPTVVELGFGSHSYSHQSFRAAASIAALSVGVNLFLRGYAIDVRR
jgi:hypothetical protein